MAVTVPGLDGRPSSVIVPSNVAVAGSVIEPPGPAETDGAVLGVPLLLELSAGPVPEGVNDVSSVRMIRSIR